MITEIFIKISVIVTTFDRAALLRRALDSVYRQTLQPFEVVVVDDGSTDGTPALLAEYAARGLRVLRQANRGASAARNAGLRATTGELVAFLDDDDEWASHKLARQVERLARAPAPETIAVVGCGFRAVHRGRTFWTNVEREERRLRLAEAFAEFPAYPSSWLVRGEAARACAFDETLHAGEDHVYLLDVLVHGELLIVPEALYDYDFPFGGRSMLDAQTVTSIEARARWLARRPALIEPRDAARVGAAVGAALQAPLTRAVHFAPADVPRMRAVFDTLRSALPGFREPQPRGLPFALLSRWVRSAAWRYFAWMRLRALLR